MTRGRRSYDVALERVLEDEANLSPVDPDDLMVTERVLTVGRTITSDFAREYDREIYEVGEAVKQARRGEYYEYATSWSERTI